MFVAINEVSRHERGFIYVLVDIWRAQADADAGDPPLLSNDFIIQIRRQIIRIVTDASGNLKRADGVFVAPEDVTGADKAIGWEWETITKTNPALRQEVIEHIRDYWRRAKAAALAGRAFPRKHDNRERMVRNNTDTDGILARLAALRGLRQEVAE